MTSQRSATPVSRRTTLAAIAGGGLGMALFAGNQAATAQSGPVDHSDHPLTGTWLVKANPPRPEDPQVFNTAVFGADGFVLLTFPLSQMGMNGVQFNTPLIGAWEPHDAQTGHFTAVQLLSDSEGGQLGTVTVDGFPRASDDRQTFIDDGSLVTVTIRDSAGAILAVVPPGTPGRPVTGWRMGVGAPGFPDDDAATPES